MVIAGLSSRTATAWIPASGVRSSWAASARKPRVSSAARRACTAALRARDSALERVEHVVEGAAARPSSVRGRFGASREPRSPAVIRRASVVIRSNGRSAVAIPPSNTSAATIIAATAATAMTTRSWRRTSVIAVVSPTSTTVFPSLSTFVTVVLVLSGGVGGPGAPALASPGTDSTGGVGGFGGDCGASPGPSGPRPGSP